MRVKVLSSWIWALTALVVALLLAIGTVVSTGLSPPSQTEPLRSDETALAVEDGRPSIASGLAIPTASVPVDPILEGRATVASTPTTAPAQSGTLLLHVVDASTGEPVSGLEYVVYSERRHNARLGNGTTDAAGRARISDLPADVLLVQTERKPPYAAALRALSLAKNETRALELRVGSGGKVQGRVVDDLGQPRSGVHILIDGGAAADQSLVPALPRTQVLAGTTEAEGRFGVDHLQSRPAGVWVVEGEERPERWDPVVLYVADARWGDVGKVRLSAQVELGATVELADTILPREVRLSGFVRYADGEPAAGILVSPHWKRAVELSASADASGPQPSGAIDLVERDGEVWTGADGSFDLASPVARGSTTTTLCLCTRSGIRELVSIPDTKPGTHVQGLALELKYRAPFEIAVSAAGEPLPERARFALRHHLRDGAIRTEYLGLDRDGVLRPHHDESWRDTRSIELETEGFARARLELERGLEEGGRAQVGLAPLPRIRLAVEWMTENADEAPFDGNLSFRACIAAPEVRARTGEDRPPCCGLGAETYRKPALAEAGFELAVRTRRPYWIYVGGTGRAEQLRESAHGPFVASEELHVLQLDPRDVVPAPGSEETPKVVPPRSSPEAECVVVARIVDARSGDPLRGSLGLQRMPGDESRVGSYDFSADAEGNVRGSPRPGIWYPSIRARGYARLDLPPITLEPAARVDLGTIDLEPFPVFRARVVDAAGAPAVGLSVGTQRCWADVDADGSVELRCDLPTSFVLRISEDYPSSSLVAPGVQATYVAGWTPGRTTELVLRPWRAVEVEVDGLDEDLRSASFDVTAKFLDFADDPGAGLLSPARASEIDSGSEGARRFALRLAPGRYRLIAWSLAFETSPLDFIVEEGSDVQTLRMSVR